MTRSNEFDFDSSRISPSTSITQMSWRPSSEQFVVVGDIEDHEDEQKITQIAIACEDSSLRLCSIRNMHHS